MSYRETRLADHDQRQIASVIAGALLDLTGSVYEVEVINLEPHADDQADIRLWVRRVDDSEIPDAEKG